ncbi:MAG TPA: hypothetical protein VKA70_00755 [Blastocatellia bacterium]|nr:hypothetical protein [Blastocatellia bacterium]
MTKSCRFFSAAALALLLGVLGDASAQIDKKPYTDWSEKEAEKLLEKSGWAQTQIFTDTTGTFSTGPGRTVNSSQSRSAGIDQVNFHIRFLSAKPVRQAISRIMEIRQKGELSDQMAAQLKSFATSDFPDFVVVTVTVDGSQAQGRLQEANALLNRLTTVDLKNNTYLIVKDQRVFLEEYQPPRRDGLGARFIFRRTIDGKPVIEAESDEVKFVSELSSAYKLNMRYKVKEMIYQGKLEY